MSVNDLPWIVVSVFFIAYSIHLKIKINKKNVQNLSLDEQLEEKKEKLNLIKAEYKTTEQKLESLIDMEKNSSELRLKNIELNRSKDELTKTIEGLTNDCKQISNNISEKQKELEAVKSDLSIYKEDMNFISVGHIPEPEYLFNNSDRYKAEIKIIRNLQSQMIKDNRAVKLPKSIALIEDDSYTKNVLSGQAKLMLKAFNLECDTLINNLKVSNYPAILERIERIANEIESNSISLKAGISNEYVELKFRECELQYQFAKLENEEKIEQAAIKEQLKEEAKVRAEAERIQREAEREEEAARRALEKAQKDFDKASEEQKAKFESIIENLQIKLREAEEKGQRAISMAQQTKCGHVYIISNLGSFGENVFKIGMTRRLDPMERVNELGDASVPFEFDVHAMIYSEDAPALEKKLHEAFGNQRANLVNPRKEFFYVSIDQIERWSIENGLEFKLTKLAEARSYKDSIAIRRRLKTNDATVLPLGEKNTQ